MVFFYCSFIVVINGKKHDHIIAKKQSESPLYSNISIGILFMLVNIVVRCFVPMGIVAIIHSERPVCFRFVSFEACYPRNSSADPPTVSVIHQKRAREGAENRYHSI